MFMYWLFKNTDLYSQVCNFILSSILYCDSLTSIHSVNSHSVNEVGKQVFKWWFARWFYRTQTDACGSRAIEWFWRLAHGCWSPLPTYRILCDAGSDDLLGRICHPVCSVSVTPSKARLIGFCNKRNTPVRCHRENLQGSTSLCRFSQRQRFSGMCIFKTVGMLGYADFLRNIFEMTC